MSQGHRSHPLTRLVVLLSFVGLAYIAAAVASCYDHLHPPATNGDPTAYPPLTDSKSPADAGSQP